MNTMQTSHNDLPPRDSQLGRSIAALTQGRDEPTELWSKAFDAHAKTGRRRRVWRLRGVGVALAASLCLVAAIGIMLPSMQAARREPTASAKADDKQIAYRKSLDRPDTERAKSLFSSEGAQLQLKDQEILGRTILRVPPSTPGASDAHSERQIVHKSQIDLKVPSVRSAYAKIPLLLSQATGEHVEQSSINGQNAAESATLTLRVAAPRMSAVLDSLRGMGAVMTETATGEDVTDQSVDLEARLRNEQRVEQELLGLMDHKPQATLEDVLKVRDRLSDVRERIEKLVAQRDHLSRMVSLGTIVVTLFPEAAPEVKQADSFMAYTAERFTQAWERGTRGLANSLAWLVEVAVGGLVVWIVLAFLAILALAAVRSVGRRAATEPPPPAPR